MDIDEVQIAILEENIKTTNEISTDISAQLAMLARINKQAIYSVTPLMYKIHDLNIREKNLHAIDDKVSEVKSYASKVRRLIDSLDQGIDNGMESTGDIQKYINSLDGLDQINRELNGGQSLGGFEGLKESLGEGILNGELSLKNSLLTKMKQVCQIQSQNENNNSDKVINKLIEEMRLIYAYLTNDRDMTSLEDVMLRERINFIKRDISKIKLNKPNINKDQNYIYDGAANGFSFPDYTNNIKIIINRENLFINKLFQGLVNSLPRIINKVNRIIIDGYIYELNALIEFIEMRKSSYNTMYYEIATGTNMIISWMYENQIEINNTLQQLTDRCNNEAKNTFNEFFEYIRNRYNEMIINEDNNETLNNTFMLIATRIHKLTIFRSYQIEFISKLKINEWLNNINLPNGFLIEKDNSNDSQFLLSTFYSDLIEYSFYSLSNKYENINKREEDIGIILLFNLDGLQNLLEGKSILKQIIGKRGVERYERLKKKAMDKAVSPWSKLTASLMMASTKQGGQLSMNSKELVKFIDEFNIKFDDNCSQFRRKEMPDYFRKQMISDISKTLIPSYKIFYSNINGSGGASNKNVAKHVQYSPEDLSGRLSQLGR